MDVGYERRSSPLFCASTGIIREVSAQWRDAHGTTVAHRALAAEGFRSGIAPVRSGHNFTHLNTSHFAVATVGISLESPHESFCQCILVNKPVRLQHRYNRDRHFCVVRMKPRTGWKIVLRKPARRSLSLITQHFSNRIAQAEAV